MAIDDLPAVANFRQAQEITQAIQSAGKAYREASNSLKTARASLRDRREEWAEERQDQLKRLSDLNKHIEHYTRKIGELLPVSVFPSLIIDDPKSPPPDEGAAADMKDAVTGMGYDEVAELVRDQEMLRELRQKREAAIAMGKINETNFPKLIKRLEGRVNETETLLRAARGRLDETQALRPDIVNEYVAGRGLGSLDPSRRKVELSELPPMWKQYFRIQLDKHRPITSAKQLAEVTKEEEEAIAKQAIAAEKKIEAEKRLQEKRDAADAEKDRRIEVLEQQVAVLSDSVQADAAKTPTEIIALRKTIFLKPNSADKRTMRLDKKFLNKRQPVGKRIECHFVEGEKGEHCRKQIGVRAGVHIPEMRFEIRVDAHMPNDYMPDGNMFLCTLMDSGVQCRLALGEGDNEKFVARTCFNKNKKWDVPFEKSLHPTVPNDACDNLDYTPEQRIAFNKLLEVKLIEMG